MADKLVVSNGDVNVTTGDVKLADNGKAIFGAGSDLQIYHNGTDSVVDDQGTGKLVLKGNTAVEIRGTNGEDLAGFNMNGAVNLYYDNSEKLATTSTGIDVTGTVTADGLTVEKSAAAVSTLNRTSSDGDIISFRKDGTTVGSIGSYAGVYTNIGTSNVGLMFNTGAGAVIPHNMSTNTPADNSLNLGQAGYRWKDLYLSGGVYLGGTGSANYLDDYEEGTWTPTIESSATNPTVSYVEQTGLYVKVGNLVCFSLSLQFTCSSTGSGTLLIANLPFTTLSSGSWQGGFNTAYFSNGNSESPSSGMRGSGYASSNATSFRISSSASNTNVQATELATSGNIHIICGGTYYSN